jgi:hypothetical protein
MSAETSGKTSLPFEPELTLDIQLHGQSLVEDCYRSITRKINCGLTERAFTSGRQKCSGQLMQLGAIVRNG